jgi:integrase
MPCEGPKYVVKKGKMPVLTADEARTFLGSIPIRKATDQNGAIVEKPDLMDLCDRALIGLMAYTFARIGAALQMKVADISCRNAGDACASMRRAAKSTTFPVTTILITFWMNTLLPPTSPSTPPVICFGR